MRVADHRCSNTHPLDCIKLVVMRDRLDSNAEAWMYRVALCESTYNPHAINPSGARGLYQFMPSTFANTPQRRHSIWSARAQAFAAAWLYARDGGGSDWQCR